MNASRLSSTHQTDVKRHQWIGYFNCVRFTSWIACLKFFAEGAGLHGIPNSLFDTIFLDNSIDDNDSRILQKLADILTVNLVVWIIDHGMKCTRLFSPAIEREGQQRCYSLILLWKDYSSLFPFCMFDCQNKRHTVFLRDDEYISEAFQDFCQAFDRFDLSQIPPQTRNPQSTHITQQQQYQTEPYFFIGLPTQSTIYQQSQSDTLLSCTQSTDDSLLSLETSSHTVSSDTAQVSVYADDDAISRVTWCSAEEEPIFRSYRKKLKLSSTSKFSSTTANVTSETASSFHESIGLPKPELNNQPKRLWHKRYLQDGVKGHCTALQVEGETQRARLKLTIPKVSSDQLYIGTRVVTYDKLENEQNIVVPEGTLVKEDHEGISNKMECFLVHDDVDSDLFNGTMRCVFSKITPQENHAEEKEITVCMVKLYQNHQINKQVIKTKKLLWSRLEFALYIQTATNSFLRLSPPSYSDLIQETQGTQNINAFPLRLDLCEKGDQIIAISIDICIMKDHISVCWNDRPLKQTQFQMTNKVISFASPVGVPGNELHIRISQVKDGAMALLKEMKLRYRIHDDHEDPCGESCH